MHLVRGIMRIRILSGADPRCFNNPNFQKEPLAKQAALLYNLIRKVIGHEFRLPSVRILYFEIASKLCRVGMLFLFMIIYKR